MSPQRIQRKRTKGWRMPDGAVYVGRPSKWGNPFRVVPVGEQGLWLVWFGDVTLGQYTSIKLARKQAVDQYGRAIVRGWVGAPTPDEVRAELAGKDLACWCPLDQPCHADILLEIANGDPS